MAGHLQVSWTYRCYFTIEHNIYLYRNVFNHSAVLGAESVAAS
ncbi:hypothetical protein JCM19233_2248 [Vibrio astriarenae]|nr:hypothetical protein JCM19233_2248 [Vibrio sp. C7]